MKFFMKKGSFRKYLVLALTASMMMVSAQAMADDVKDARQDERLDAVEAVNTAQDSRLTAVESKNNRQDERLDTLSSENTAQNNRLTSVESKNNRQDERLDTLTSENTAQNNRLTSVESKNNRQDERLDALTSENTAQTTRLNTIDSKNTRQDERLDIVESENATQDSRLTAHDNEFVSLKDVLGSDYSNANFNSITMGGYTMRGTADGFDMGGARLSGLADGGVYRGSTDAVTGNQLWDVYRNMDDLREDINIVGAHAAALSGLHPIDYNPYEPTTLSAAVGTYRDEYAVAVGVFHYAKENVMFNLGASLCSDGDLMGRAGVSFTVGKSGKKQPLPPKDMNEMQAQLAQVQQALLELKASNDELKADNEELKADNEALKLTLEERN